MQQPAPTPAILFLLTLFAPTLFLSCCSNYNMKLAPAEWWVEDGQKLTKIRRGVTLEVR